VILSNHYETHFPYLHIILARGTCGLLSPSQAVQEPLTRQILNKGHIVLGHMRCTFSLSHLCVRPHEREAIGVHVKDGRDQAHLQPVAKEVESPPDPHLETPAHFPLPQVHTCLLSASVQTLNLSRCCLCWIPGNHDFLRCSSIECSTSTLATCTCSLPLVPGLPC
jgi:hypothetical protein